MSSLVTEPLLPPDTVPTASHKISHLVHTTVLWGQAMLFPFYELKKQDPSG